MFGHPVDIRAISRVCTVPVVEDCAQSLFSRFQEQETGRGATASFFSFRSGKYLSVGEGSIILCQDPELRAAIRQTVAEFETPSAFEQMRHCLATYVKSALYHRPWYGLVSYPLGRMLDKRLNLTAKAGFERTSIRRCDLAVLEQRLSGFREKEIGKEKMRSIFSGASGLSMQDCRLSALTAGVTTTSLLCVTRALKRELLLRVVAAVRH